MGPRELVLNPKLSAWRHPDGAVKANRLRCSRLLLVEPLARELRRRGRGASRRAVGDWGAVVSARAVLLARLRRPSSSPVQGADAAGAAVGNLAWLARARAVSTRRCARIHALGFGVSLMLVVVGIDQGGPSRRDAVTAGRSERCSCRAESDGAEMPSSVARASSGGHDGRLARG